MSFDEIYARYVDSVYSFLKFKLNDEYLVEEILQETFLAVYRNLNKLSTVQSPKSWILTIARHKLVDHLRSIKHEEVTLDHSMLVQEFSTDLVLNEVLNQLDSTAAAIVYGLYVEQLTCQELAEILEIPVGTVKSKAYTARAKLRNWLKGAGQ
ncbi:MAG TPA: sigma-70 family RNA polymerase sigma factor [Firmicutes bacterium]|nr:sigma-70 family RNA polymerase sigma factor [Bacillota bacterium]